MGYSRVELLSAYVVLLLSGTMTNLLHRRSDLGIVSWRRYPQEKMPVMSGKPGPLDRESFPDSLSPISVIDIDTRDCPSCIAIEVSCIICLLQVAGKRIHC